MVPGRMKMGRMVAMMLGGLAAGVVWLSGPGTSPHGRIPQSSLLAPPRDHEARGVPRETPASAPRTVEAQIAVLHPDRERRLILEPTAVLFDASDPDGRRLAIHALYGRAEPAALGALGNALGDPDLEIRWAALRVLTDMAVRGYAEPQITALLQQVLSDSDPALRTEALDALAQRGAEGLHVIKQALADPADEVRERAVALLETAYQ